MSVQATVPLESADLSSFSDFFQEPAPREIVIRVPAFHPGQERLRRKADSHKVSVFVLGRRWGKTFFGASYAFDRMTREKDPVKNAAWVAPSYDLCRIGWDEFQRLYGLAVASSNKTEHWIQLVNGSKLWFRSADNPVSIRGRGYGLMLVDEGFWIPKATFETAMLPTLADEDGDLVVFTTPGGRRGWVYEEYQRAVHKETGYTWDRAPSTENPNPNVRKWIAWRKPRMSPTAYAQEIDAEFTEDATALFHGLDLCTGGDLETPETGARYVLGVDLAKSSAWTVVHVLKLGPRPLQLVHQERFHRIDWPDQVKKVKKIADSYGKAPTVVDATGVGEPVVGMMRRAGLTVQAFEFNDESRKSILDELSIAFSNREIRMPQVLMEDVLGEELHAMAVDINERGRTIYHSRAEFTDCVMALALAWHGVPPADAGGGMKVGQTDDEDEKGSFMEERF
jgi:terminase large subunit-like protein